MAKDDPRIELLGELDELSASIGLVRAMGVRAGLDRSLASIQTALFAAGADVAAATAAGGPTARRRLRAGAVGAVERLAARLERGLPPLASFILPGGVPAAAALHVARTVCRRAERRAIEVSRGFAVGPLLKPFLNRLSAALFLAARSVNLAAGRVETVCAYRRRGGDEPQE